MTSCLIRSDEGLTLKMSAFTSLYGYFINSIDKTKHLFSLTTNAAPQFL